MDLVAELEAAFAESHPGFNVVFAGDIQGGMPPQVAAAMAEMTQRGLSSLSNGECWTCGKKIPAIWPPADEGWKWPEGWGVITDTLTDDPFALECGPCGESECDND